MKNKFILAFVIGMASVFGADLAEESKNTTTESLLDQLIVRSRAIEFDKNSPDVGGSYHFYSGQNIQNARDVHYALCFSDGKCSIETLYGLYLALQDFLAPDGQRFIPEELNAGFTKYNFEFLKKIFEK